MAKMVSMAKMAPMAKTVSMARRVKVLPENLLLRAKKQSVADRVGQNTRLAPKPPLCVTARHGRLEEHCPKNRR
jgi:hypothetical protein